MNRTIAALPAVVAWAVFSVQAQPLSDPLTEIATREASDATDARPVHTAGHSHGFGGAERSTAGEAWLSGSHAETAARRAAGIARDRELAAQAGRQARNTLAEHAARVMDEERASRATAGEEASPGPSDTARLTEAARMQKPQHGAAPEPKDPAPIEAPRPERERRIVPARATGNAVRGQLADPLADSPYDHLIRQAAAEQNVAVDLVRAVVKVESNFQSTARSPKGAIGLMQLMPATARRFGATDPHDPHTNIKAGTVYLRWLLTRFNNDLSLALAGYNAGEGAVERYGRRIPPYPETQQYVRKVLAHYHAGVGAGVANDVEAGAESAGQVAGSGHGAGDGAAAEGRGGLPDLQTMARWIEAVLPVSHRRVLEKNARPVVVATDHAPPVVAHPRPRQAPREPEAGTARRYAQSAQPPPLPSAPVQSVSGRFERGAAGAMQ